MTETEKLSFSEAKMTKDNFLKQIQERMAELEEQAEIGYREGDDSEWVCFYCGKPLDPDKFGAIHSDHIIPKSKGGSNRAFNRVFVCEHCNLVKQAKTPEAWIRLINELPDEQAVDYISRILMGNLFAVFGFANDPNLMLNNYKYRVHGYVTPNSVSKVDDLMCPECHECGGEMTVFNVNMSMTFRCDSCGENTNFDLWPQSHERDFDYEFERRYGSRKNR